MSQQEASRFPPQNLKKALDLEVPSTSQGGSIGGVEVEGLIDDFYSIDALIPFFTLHTHTTTTSPLPWQKTEGLHPGDINQAGARQLR